MTTHTHAATNPWISRRALSSWQGFGLLTWKSFLKLVLNPAMFAFALILPIFMYM
ncbi:MAG: ABC transporter permease, partial [Actinomyces sp.]|nr:ABC transporter permease [Actinomyces sp.]